MPSFKSGVSSPCDEDLFSFLCDFFKKVTKNYYSSAPACGFPAMVTVCGGVLNSLRSNNAHRQLR